VKYYVSFSIRGDQNADNVRRVWADTFDTFQSIMAKRVTPDKRHTRFDGTLYDITLLVQHVMQYGTDLESLAFQPVKE
jgi:hypothetical protein